MVQGRRGGRMMAAAALAAVTVSSALADIVPGGGISSGMVLQRDEVVTLWGYGAVPGHHVFVVVGGVNASSVAPAAASNGFWEARIGPMSAGSHGDIVFQQPGLLADTVLADVLWGDVFLCSGQSNMVFSLGQGFGDTEAIAEAGDPAYRAIRLFTVTPSEAPEPINTPNSTGDGLKVEQPWIAANSSTVSNPKAFSYFSAVCWYTGRNIFNALGRQVPVGLVTSAYGGTRVHQWSSPDALAQCNQSTRWVTASNARTADVSGSDNSGLWNAMIYPLLRTTFKGVFWLQGESDVNPVDPPGQMQPQRGGAYYGCAIKAMVLDWMKKFQTGTSAANVVPFMWVQLSPWVGHEAATSFYQLPAIRQAQLTVTTIENTGFASAVDLGDPNPDTNPWGGVHFRTKGPVGDRLATVASKLCYGNDSAQTLGPAAVSAGRVDAGVQVKFDPDSLGKLGLVDKPMLCPFFNLSQPANIARCGWYEILDRNTGSWTNTSATIDPGAQSVTVKAAATTNVSAVRYLYADWPVATLYNTEGLPATPFWLEL